MREKKQDLTGDGNHETGSRNLPDPPEPHLLDPTSLAEGARWLIEFIATATAGGVIGNAAYDYLKGVRRRAGSERIKELESEALSLVETEASRAGTDPEDLKQRLSRLFDEYR